MKTAKKKPSMVGSIHPSRTMFLREAAGEAKDPTTGDVYELSTNVGGGTPIVRLPDGRWWTITWQQLIELAQAAALASAKGEA